MEEWYHFWFHFLSLFLLQKSKTLVEEIKHFVYCMENAILNLPPNQEQVIWLVDFHGFSLSSVSFKMTREVSHILQKYYPQRLGLAIMYDAPGIFQPFFSVTKQNSLLNLLVCFFLQQMLEP